MSICQLNVEFNQAIGRVKPMHGVGQPPWLGVGGQYLHYLTEAHIPYSRLHDMGGAYGGMIYVDIPNIFRDFDADENDPSSYDFAFTDVLITKLIESGCEPIYRLGVTIENNHKIRRYRTMPPADFDKWARICEHVIRHYIEGWADGFTYDIQYWEIWNEPDDIDNPNGSPMWDGTAEEFYRLYTTAAKHFKACFGDKIKVGGYASCGFVAVLSDPEKYGLDVPAVTDVSAIRSPQYVTFVNFFNGFLAYIKKENAPMDFFSYHSYAGVDWTLVSQQYAERRLREEGYGDVEMQLNEWNTAPQLADRGTSRASAFAADMMLRMHKTKMNVMCYYDARIAASMYGGLFNPMTHTPVSTYYSFKAFGELYSLGNEVACECGRLPCLAAVSDDGTQRAVMLVNIKSAARVQGIPADMKAYLVDAEHFLTEVPMENGTLTIGHEQVVLLKNY